MASQRKKRRTELLRDAASHGPYLWSDLDVENALLWFQSLSSSSSSSSFGGGERRREDPPRRRLGTDEGLGVEEEEEEDEGKEDEGDLLEEGCEFLRLLLHAPGGESGYERPPTPRDDHGGRRRRRRRRRNDNDDGGGRVEEEEKKNRGKSSARGAARCHGYSVLEALGDDDDDVGGGRREGAAVERENESDDGAGAGGRGSNAPLRSVLLGYYRLFLIASSSSSSHPSSSSSSSTSLNEDNNHDEGDADDQVDESKSSSERGIDDASHAGMAASARLLSNLLPIVSARWGRDRDVRRAYARVVDREGGGATTVVGGSSASFDEYATRPTACARAAYASSVYDRLVDLGGGGGDRVDAVGGVDLDATPRTTAPPALRGFLRKLIGLAATDAGIREVALLVLLEPTRRSRVDRLDDIARRRPTRRAVDAPPTARAPSSHGAALSSASHQRDDVSSEKDAEEACSRPPLSTLVRSILLTSRPGGRMRAAAADEGDDDDISARRATTTTRAAAAAAAAWWTLPCPLLCCVSHACLPIASEYVRYWIEMAAIGHAKLYDGPPAMDHPDDGGGMGNGDGNNNGDEDDGELFRRAICRIIQFRSTSDRLGSLCRHALHSIDGKSMGSSVESYSKGDEDEDFAFKTSLAWKAIHRALER